MTVYTRPLSPLERVCYLGYDKGDTSPRMMQFILEGVRGDTLDVSLWRKAVEYVALQCPSSRLRLRGHLGWSHWHASGITPEISVIENTSWNARSLQQAPFLNRRLDTRHGPLCRVVLLQGVVPRVLFQIHHAAMDGMGAIQWIRNLLRFQRGEEIHAINSVAYDVALSQSQQSVPRRAKSSNAIAPLGIANPNSVGVPLFTRRSLAINDHQLIARLAAALVEFAAPLLEADATGNHVLRIAVPVDLRRHLPEGENSSANLTGVIELEPTPGQGVRDIQKSIITSLREKEDLQFPASLSRAKWWPVRLLTQGERSVLQVLARRQFYYSAYISAMGRHDPSQYTVPGFTCNNVYGVITPHPGVPLYISYATLPTRVELMVGSHSCYCDESHFNRFVDQLCAWIA